MLLGHSDDNAGEDAGNLRVTYHHNWFDGSGTRHPRVRFGNPVHVYNNYYNGNEYGVASTMNAGVLIEGNYFDRLVRRTPGRRRVGGGTGARPRGPPGRGDQRLRPGRAGPHAGRRDRPAAPGRGPRPSTRLGYAGRS